MTVLTVSNFTKRTNYEKRLTDGHASQFFYHKKYKTIQIKIKIFFTKNLTICLLQIFRTLQTRKWLDENNLYFN